MGLPSAFTSAAGGAAGEAASADSESPSPVGIAISAPTATATTTAIASAISPRVIKRNRPIGLGRQHVDHETAEQDQPGDHGWKLEAAAQAQGPVGEGAAEQSEQATAAAEAAAAELALAQDRAEAAETQLEEREAAASSVVGDLAKAREQSDVARTRVAELESELAAVRDRAELAGAAEQRVAALEAQLVERDAQATAAAEALAASRDAERALVEALIARFADAAPTPGADEALDGMMRDEDLVAFLKAEAAARGATESIARMTAHAAAAREGWRPATPGGHGDAGGHGAGRDGTSCAYGNPFAKIFTRARAHHLKCSTSIFLSFWHLSGYLGYLICVN